VSSKEAGLGRRRQRGHTTSHTECGLEERVCFRAEAVNESWKLSATTRRRLRRRKEGEEEGEEEEQMVVVVAVKEDEEEELGSRARL